MPIAEYVLAAMLEWTVKLRAMDASLRQCTWRSQPPGNNCSRQTLTHGQIANKTLGILGYGHIGEAIATRAAAFGMRVVATTLQPPQIPPAPLTWIGDDKSNPRLFRESDFLVVATPLLASTRGLVDAELLAELSTTAVLINIARGPIVQEQPLYEALHTGKIGGAVLDVWWHPLFNQTQGGTGPANWPSKFRFDELPNVIMSPHVSGDTPEALIESTREVAANLDALALGKPLENVVRKASGPTTSSYRLA